MSLRKVTSLTTLLSFILLIITSIILYITPQGKIAYWANWSCWGIDKKEWGALHTNLGFLFLIASVIHIALNWNCIMAYLKNKAKKFKLFTIDFNISLVITLVITVMTLFSLPPINAIQTFNESLKDTAAKKYGAPPYGHAEASSLKFFCQRTGLDLNKSKEKLIEAGIRFDSDRSTIAEIAEANQMTPKQIYDAIRTKNTKGQFEIAEGSCETILHDSGSGLGSGFGRKTLAELCAENNLDLQAAIGKLNEQGIEANANSKVKNIADHGNMKPSKVLDAIK